MTVVVQKPWDKMHKKIGMTVPPYRHGTPADWVGHYAGIVGDRPALFYGETTITYATVNDHASHFANYLQASGIKKGDVVGIHLPNIPHSVIAMIGAMKVGLTVSGVSTLLMPSELENQLADSGVTVLVTLRPHFQDKIQALSMPSVRLIIVVDDESGLDKTSDWCDLTAPRGKTVVGFCSVMRTTEPAYTPVVMDPDDVLFIQYTGGTTGKPKGAMLSVRNVMYDVQLYSSTYGLKQGQECLVTAFPLYHLAGMSLLLLAIFYGAGFILLPNPRDLEAFCSMMRRHPPSIMGAVPTLYQMLVDHPTFADVDYSNMKIAISGGAPFPVDLKRRLETVIGTHTVSDNFGMTETGPVYLNNPKGHAKFESVGIPIAGVDVKIVDVEDGVREMPLGESGEIITSGPHVMLGYLNNPEETKKALRQRDGKTWMHTGDVGYMTEDGYVILCDRLKDMAVVGGYKVFSVEVEAKLKELDFIAAAALVAMPDPNRAGSDILTLFVQKKPDAAVLSDDELAHKVQAFCRAEMAPYKVPKHIKAIDSIPLTPIGKLDKKALRAKLA